MRKALNLEYKSDMVALAYELVPSLFPVANSVGMRNCMWNNVQSKFFVDYDQRDAGITLLSER